VSAKTLPVPENPIQRLLSNRQVPWQESQAALIARHGIGPDPWWDGPPVVSIEIDPPPLPGLLRPLRFEPGTRHDPTLPPLLLSGWAWASRSRWMSSRSVASLRLVAETLGPTLGRGEVYDTSNTKGLRWRFGPASVEAICFPRWQNLGASGNPAARADRRFPDSCWVSIRTGYRATCTPEEHGLLDMFEAAFTLETSAGPAAIAANPPRQEVLEYIREPVAGVERALGRIGRSADGATIIFATDQVYFVPRAQIAHIELVRAARARGSGYATLSLACRGSFGDGPIRPAFLAHSAEPQGLDDLASRLAVWLERPCLFEDGLDD
jgi:hypothetical protein